MLTKIKPKRIEKILRKELGKTSDPSKDIENNLGISDKQFVAELREKLIFKKRRLNG